MRHVVIDTNCLVQMISKRSPYRRAWDTFLEGSYFMCVSNEIINEYHEILNRVASADVAEYIVNTILRHPNTKRYDPRFRFRLIQEDDDDNKFVDCAIIAGADYIVSEDSHFQVLSRIPYPKVLVKRLDDFIEDLFPMKNQ